MAYNKRSFPFVDLEPRSLKHGSPGSSPGSFLPLPAPGGSRCPLAPGLCHSSITPWLTSPPPSVPQLPLRTVPVGFNAYPHNQGWSHHFQILHCIDKDPCSKVLSTACVDGWRPGHTSGGHLLPFMLCKHLERDWAGTDHHLRVEEQCWLELL
jgi:hypothetical protein